MLTFRKQIPIQHQIVTLDQIPRSSYLPNLPLPRPFNIRGGRGREETVSAPPKLVKLAASFGKLVFEQTGRKRNTYEDRRPNDSVQQHTRADKEAKHEERRRLTAT